LSEVVQIRNATRHTPYVEIGLAFNDDRLPLIMFGTDIGEDLPEISAELVPSSLNLECASSTPATFIFDEPTAGAAF
jgi:hypothetical protein